MVEFENANESAWISKFTSTPILIWNTLKKTWKQFKSRVDLQEINGDIISLVVGSVSTLSSRMVQFDGEAIPLSGSMWKSGNLWIMKNSLQSQTTTRAIQILQRKGW